MWELHANSGLAYNYHDKASMHAQKLKLMRTATYHGHINTMIIYWNSGDQPKATQEKTEPLGLNIDSE